MDILQVYVSVNGRLNTVVVADHAGREDHRQQFGSGETRFNMSLADFKSLAALMNSDGVIILGGCGTALNREFVQSIADATGLTVIAATSKVRWGPNELDGLDYWVSNGGVWATFAPAGQQPTTMPSSHGLRHGSPSSPNN